MELLMVGIAGIVATAVMTLFMYGLTYLTDYQMKVVKILGTMLTDQAGPKGTLSDYSAVIVVGTLAHYAVGIFFAICYRFLWQAGIGRPTPDSGAVFGFISGLIAIIVWRTFFLVHPRPPKTVPLFPYSIALLLTHIIFGLVVNLTFTGLLQLVSNSI